MSKAKRFSMAILMMLVLLVLSSCGGPEHTYKQAQELLSKGEYSAAAEKFQSLGSYEDAATLTMYCKACALCESGNFEAGIAGFESLGNYKDCSLRITYYTARSWDDNSVGTTEFEWMERGKSIYNKNPLYLDSAERITALDARIETAKKTLYDNAVAAAEQGQYSTAIATFQRLGNYKDSAQRATYYGIRADEDALAGTTDETAYDAVAARYTKMGEYLDCADRAATLTAQATAIRDDKYNAAVVLLNEGKYYEAYVVFKALNGYKDSEMYAQTIDEARPIVSYQAAKVGDYVIFGTYEQDNNTMNGPEGIEWMVLAKENDRMLVISRYALDYQKYHPGYGDISWEECNLRKWLQEHFYSIAFTDAEKKMIANYETNRFSDKVTLLSPYEVEEYFPTNRARTCTLTAYAAQKSTEKSAYPLCKWWIRSPGAYQRMACFWGGVYADGEIGFFTDSAAVRPALWINLD